VVDEHAAPPAPDGRAIALAAVAGIATGIVGGIAWGLIVKLSDYEIGIVAWGIGFVVGTAVLVAAGRRKGLPLQLVAVVGALVGILVGKYLAYAMVIQELASEQGVDVGLLSSQMRELFRDDLDSVFGWFDLLWAGLAVFTAWRLLAPDPEPGRGPEPAS
jgi:hypothetical protein